MANFTTTEYLTRALLVSQSMSSGIQKGELRGKLNGSIDAMLQSTPLLIQGGQASLDELKTRVDHDVKIPVMKRSTRTVGSARNCATSTSTDDSALVTPTWATITDGGFQINLSTSYGNMFNFEQQVASHFKESFRILHEKMSLDNLTFLEANKATAAGQVGTINTYNVLNGQMQVSLANKDDYFGSAYAEMRENRYSGPYTHIHTLGKMEFEIARQTAQGAGNSTNLAWQPGLGWNHFPEQQFTGASGTTGSSYIFEPGTVGLFSWTRPDFRAGINLGDIDVWTTIPDPVYPGLTWELKINRSCGNGNSYNTGGAGYENSDLIKFLISADFSRLGRYTSTAGDTGIMKYAQMSV